MKHRRGFTLMELLVVIGIIVTLIALLLPSVVRAKHQASMVRCASDEGQFVHAARLYALDHNGFLPRFDASTGAGNPHDVTLSFYKAIAFYGLPHRGFFCPFTDQVIIDQPLTTNPLGMVQIGYAWWVPRVNANPPTKTPIFPPDPPSANVIGNELIRGPIFIGDPVEARNPILTDDIYLHTPVTSPATFKVYLAQPLAFWQGQGDSSHLYHGVLDTLNEAYLDGHVEQVAPTWVHCVYQSGNAWVCR
jgi:prepilin-type N-terminal cleavage/methylation domain-containing protein